MIANKIYELRMVRKLSQNEMAKAVGVNQKTISKWETGSSMPDAIYIQKLAEAFDLPVTYFYGGSSEKDNVTELLDKLINQGIIKDPDNISEPVKDIILESVKTYVRLKQLDQQP